MPGTRRRQCARALASVHNGALPVPTAVSIVAKRSTPDHMQAPHIQITTLYLAQGPACASGPLLRAQEVITRFREHRAYALCSPPGSDVRALGTTLRHDCSAHVTSVADANVLRARQPLAQRADGAAQLRISLRRATLRDA